MLDKNGKQNKENTFTQVISRFYLLNIKRRKTIIDSIY